MESLSVFFPCFNEEDNIKSTVSKASKVLESLRVNYEILIIDDGSTDKTGEVADKLALNDKRVSVIHQINGGYGEALKAGFNNAKYKWVVYTDSDGQFDFSEVNKFLDKQSGADLILGYRIKRSDPFIRSLLAGGWRMTLFICFGLHLKDVDCGFKMIKKKTWEKISPLTSSRGAMVNAELAIRAKRQGFRVVEIGVNHYPRLLGTPTGASLKVIVNSYLDLIKLWLSLR